MVKGTGFEIWRSQVQILYNGFVLGSPELNSSVAVCKQLTGLPLTSWDSQQVYVASEVFVSRFKVSPISMYVLNTMALTEIN